jgi:hypothetical protein
VEYIILDADQDVRNAANYAFSGRIVHVEVEVEMGPDGPEPKVELLRVLLDQTRSMIPYAYLD